MYTANGFVVSGSLTLTLASGALLTIHADGSFSYNPNGHFSTGGTDSFNYQALESNGLLSDTATVTITVIGT